MYKYIMIACLVLSGCGASVAPKNNNLAMGNNVISANNARAILIRASDSAYVLLLDDSYYMPSQKEVKNIIAGYRGYYYCRQWDCNKIARDLQAYTMRYFKQHIASKAQGEGIACFLVCYQLPTTKHAILGFITSDKGIIYYDSTEKKFLPNVTNIFYIGD